MNKTVIVALLFIFAVVFFVFRITGNSVYDKKSLAKIPYSLVCTNCAATMTYTTEQLERFVRKGQYFEVPLQVRRFPCVKCGTLSALSYPGNPEAGHAPRQ